MFLLFSLLTCMGCLKTRMFILAISPNYAQKDVRVGDKSEMDLFLFIIRVCQNWPRAIPPRSGLGLDLEDCMVVLSCLFDHFETSPINRVEVGIWID